MPEGGVVKQSEPVSLPPTSAADKVDIQNLRERARTLARSWTNLARKTKTKELAPRFEATIVVLAGLQHAVDSRKRELLTEDLKWLSDNLRLVANDIIELRTVIKDLRKMPLVRTSEYGDMPRAWILMRGLVDATQGEVTEQNLVQFVDAAEEVDPLDHKELWALPQFLKLVLLDEIAKRGEHAYINFARQTQGAPPANLDRAIISLRLVGELEWEGFLEPLSPVHRILREDPAAVYSRMDDLTREHYRTAVSDLAEHSHMREADIAQLAIQMARNSPLPKPGDRSEEKRRHVGYYLVDRGLRLLRQQIRYRPSFDTWLQQFLRNNPDEVYIIGIEFVTLITIAGIILPFSHGRYPLTMLLLCGILLLIPVTQAAVEILNYWITSILRPEPLPKFDFKDGVPPDCATLVTVPTLLINERQIRQLVEDLEVRYLGNQDPNIHFALLTDLPDTPERSEEEDPRVELAVKLIEELNDKYSALGYGQFFLFHRHRVFNPQEGTWMGWERKRGKLLDLNKVLRNAFDPFPVKAGNLRALNQIRFVITLDSDTQLPRGEAARMIGAMAHPLNAAVIDKKRNLVTEGYGILQPRVGVSVQSASRSRLAALYSGQTGFDIYTRAVSDVYQDLYGEGIFTGKGIYEIDVLREVLESRFPTNTLLSHDLIEGAYSRAGLLSDVEVIDDYPSHYSAFNRRKHRWLRGDWQIARWLLGRVPDEQGRLVKNPISLVSRWKIFDNLRRSMVEPATFLLLVSGWLFLPGGPGTWSCIVAGLLFLPGLFQFLFGLFRFVRLGKSIVLTETFRNLVSAFATVTLNLVFLAHQALVALDAIFRTLVRSTITRSRLLEWETATEAELGLKKRTPVDTYQNWIPLLSLVIGVIVALGNPKALPYALPVLIVWACSKLVSNWLNRPPISEPHSVGKSERKLARHTFLKTWRFFVEFSTERNNWLIPDNVQDNPRIVAERLSPTNLGFLLNARQAAHELGFLTLPELATLTDKTLAAVTQLPVYEGHFYNWYDTLTLKPLEPLFLSTVDNGNLVASLWALKQGLREKLRQPIISPSLRTALRDQFSLLHDLRAIGRKTTNELHAIQTHDDTWVTAYLMAAPAWIERANKRALSEEADWWLNDSQKRMEAIRNLLEDFAPWFLPEFASLHAIEALQLRHTLSKLTLVHAPDVYRAIDGRLQTLVRDGGNETLHPAIQKLRDLLPECKRRATELTQQLQSLADIANHIAEEMDFTTLYDHRRKLLMVGYDAGTKQPVTACYDLLASEARIAAFVSIAKGEIPQESWFRLGRGHTVWEGETVMASWTGTTFEYLMPCLWMNLYPNTLLDRTARAAVRIQQIYGAKHRVPWGISESAWSEQNAEGHYQYKAFGIPQIALKGGDTPRLVISPYSAALALTVDPEGALADFSRMAALRWMGPYGFYESVDFGATKRRYLPWRKGTIVRMWMAHHQGMTMLALANWLADEPFVRWFHSEPRVQATELLLQEKPLRAKPMASVRPDISRIVRVQKWKPAV
jgi:hypothetical protein